jgi:hypothetical protein
MFEEDFWDTLFLPDTRSVEATFGHQQACKNSEIATNDTLPAKIHWKHNKTLSGGHC